MFKDRALTLFYAMFCSNGNLSNLWGIEKESSLFGKKNVVLVGKVKFVTSDLLKNVGLL